MIAYIFIALPLLVVLSRLGDLIGRAGGMGRAFRDNRILSWFGALLVSTAVTVVMLVRMKSEGGHGADGLIFLLPMFQVASAVIAYSFVRVPYLLATRVTRRK